MKLRPAAPRKPPRKGIPSGWSRRMRKDGTIIYKLFKRQFYWYVEINARSSRHDIARQLIKERNEFSYFISQDVTTHGGE
jgi:hypothetical protein